MGEKFPVMVAMRGPSTNRKREIARQLSAYLLYPLLDEEDVIPILENSNSSIDTTHDLALKIITQITSTQLDSKLKVIINTPLSKHHEFIQLVQLASSKHSSLIIIECSSRYNDQAFDMYDIVNLSSLAINMEEAFEVEDFAPELLRIIESHKEVDLGAAFQDQESKDSFDEKIREQWHAHEFSIITDASVANLGNFSCNRCKKSISGATYKCIECDEFILHKECAEFSDELDDLRKKGPWYLCDNAPEKSFSGKNECKVCDKFSRACPNCLYQSRIESEFLPSIFKYEAHEHPLNFVIMPSWFNFTYKCCKCDKLGNSTSYKCYSCNFDLHLDCALPPPSPEYVVIAPPRLFNFLPDVYQRGFVVIGWNDLKRMPHQLQSGIALRNLVIFSFDEVEALPVWLGNLSSLRALWIDKCKNLKHLPSATVLQELVRLIIHDCPLLKESCAKGVALGGPRFLISHSST